MSNRWARLVNDPNFKIKPKTPKQVKEPTPKVEEDKPAAKPVYDNYVSEKRHVEIRTMFFDLLFTVKLKDRERALIEPWYHEFELSGKLSPAQRSTLATIWVKYESEKKKVKAAKEAKAATKQQSKTA